MILLLASASAVALHYITLNSEWKNAYAAAAEVVDVDVDV